MNKLIEAGVCEMASQQEKAFCVLRFEVSRSVITVQREFRAARFRLWLTHTNACQDKPTILRSKATQDSINTLFVNIYVRITFLDLTF